MKKEEIKNLINENEGRLQSGRNIITNMKIVRNQMRTQVLSYAEACEKLIFINLQVNELSRILILLCKFAAEAEALLQLAIIKQDIDEIADLELISSDLRSISYKIKEFSIEAMDFLKHST